MKILKNRSDIISMKRKLDFVTNSSSVSYVGWGVYLSKKDINIMKLYHFIRRHSHLTNNADIKMSIIIIG